MIKTSNWIKLGETSGFPSGSKTLAKIDQDEILVYNDGVNWFAFERKCTHQSRPMDDGRIEGSHLECVFHGVRYDLQSGRVLDGRGYMNLPNLKVYHVKIENNQVFVYRKPKTIESWDRGLEF